MIRSKINLVPLMAIVILCSSFTVKDDIRDNNGDTTPLSNTEKLTSKYWRMVNSIEANNGSIVDYFIYEPACFKDNLTKFNADGSLQIVEGDSKCYETDPEIAFETKWEFTKSENFMLVYGEMYKIISLTDEQLILKSTDYTEELGALETTITYQVEN